MTTVDGTEQVVTVTITGTNDAAIICGTKTGSVIEAGGGTCGTPTATGTLTDTDVDNPHNSFSAVDCPRESDAGYGTFTMTADGVWTFKLDNNNCAVQALDACDTLTDTFMVTTVDGTPQVVTVTINGSNDADQNYFDHLATEKVIFDGRSLLGLGDSFHFKDKISGSEFSDLVDLADVGQTPGSIGRHENAAGPHGPPAIPEEVPTTELSLLEQASAHTGSAAGTHLHDLMV